ncbi:MAG: hypothetical protein KGJ87_10120 [Planctomycetota bacterium]|nr:hypothetical protein [Planctomycetota bacterium]MDE1888790.1 hypothetical protein [Planctomycetota bacterium]MDE2217498.1 hypothetical protein [Planctomycetota bacterium]
MIETFFELIGKIVLYGGGAVGIAYGLFVFLGKNWIENKFATRLEAYKAEQNKELEDVKYKINTLFNRVLKIHDKEMEILPEAWSRLHDAIDHISSLVSVYQEYPDFRKLKDPEIVSYLKSINWNQHQIDELLEATDRNKHFQENIFWHRLADAKKRFSDFHKFIIRNKIFMGEELKNHFSKVGDLLWESLVTKEVGEEAKDYKMIVESYTKLKENLNQIVSDIEKSMQKRLRYHEAV